MNDYIQKIYDMMYLPILTPYNLLENAKLENYSYVKYYKDLKGLIAEIECEIPDEGMRTFYYKFDDRDFLQKITVVINESEEIVFERQKEILHAKEDYYQNKLIKNKIG